MEITIEDIRYESHPKQYRGTCDGCMFDARDAPYNGCSRSNDKYDCSDHRVIWKLKEVPTVKPPIEAPVDQKLGTKYDDEKIQYTLIPPYALQEVARNLTVGLRKYKERDNWKKVEGAEQRYMDALYRHIEAVRRGEIYDNESGAENMPHMAAVVANAMFLLEFMLDPKLKKGTE